MRRPCLIILTMLFLAVAVVAAAKDGAQYFRLLEAQEYALDMLYSSELERVYVQVEFSVDRASLDPEARYGMFLDNSAIVQAIMVGGLDQTSYQVSNLKPALFKPKLNQPELLLENSPNGFLGINLPALSQLPPIVQIKLWYYLPVPPVTEQKDQNLATDLDAKRYWYPRNIHGDAKVNLKLTTVKYFILQIGDVAAPRVDGEFGRVHEISYTDKAKKPATFRLIRDRS